MTAQTTTMALISASAISSDTDTPCFRTVHQACGTLNRGSRSRFRGALRYLVPALCLLQSFTIDIHAEGVDQEPEAFINEVFGGHPPASGVLWITRPLREQMTQILEHAPDALRVRYWGTKHRTVWILEEIGKERPITVGLVVDKARLETVKVLAFRESRGWEVRYPFFTDQFKGVGLSGDNELDQTIDGISGATLSVRALKKLARLALLLHEQTPMANGTP